MLPSNTFTILLILAGASCLICDVHAGYDPKNCYDAEWTQKNDKFVTPYTYTNISGCQKTTLNFDSYNKLPLGGKGDSDWCGIGLGSGSDGVCDGGDSCMTACQAMCCITLGCETASVYRKDDQDCEWYGTCTSTSIFYCFMHKKGNAWSSSDNYAACISNAGAQPADCPALVLASKFKWDSATYNYLLSLGNYETCPSRRKLQSIPSLENLPTSGEEIQASIKEKLANMPFTLKQVAENAAALDGQCKLSAKNSRYAKFIRFAITIVNKCREPFSA